MLDEPVYQNRQLPHLPLSNQTPPSLEPHKTKPQTILGAPGCSYSYAVPSFLTIYFFWSVQLFHFLTTFPYCFEMSLYLYFNPWIRGQEPGTPSLDPTGIESWWLLWEAHSDLRDSAFSEILATLQQEASWDESVWASLFWIVSSKPGRVTGWNTVSTCLLSYHHPNKNNQSHGWKGQRNALSADSEVWMPILTQSRV